MPVPRKVSLGGSQVTIEWSDGHSSAYANVRLREACPCAMCQGEPPALGLGRIIPMMVAAPEGIFAERYSMVGRYAISFDWSDGHRTGIYPYEYLLEICECETCAARAATKVGQGGLIPRRRE